MLSEEDRQRITEEESLREQLREERTKARRDSRTRTLILVAATVAVSLIVIRLAWLLMPDPTTDPLYGTTRNFGGRVTKSDRATFSDLPFLEIKADGMTVKCYTEELVPDGTKVTATGFVRVWTELGGTLRPCSVTRSK